MPQKAPKRFQLSPDFKSFAKDTNTIAPAAIPIAAAKTDIEICPSNQPRAVPQGVTKPVSAVNIRI